MGCRKSSITSINNSSSSTTKSCDDDSPRADNHDLKATSGAVSSTPKTTEDMGSFKRKESLSKPVVGHDLQSRRNTDTGNIMPVATLPSKYNEQALLALQNRKEEQPEPRSLAFQLSTPKARWRHQQAKSVDFIADTKVTTGRRLPEQAQISIEKDDTEETEQSHSVTRKRPLFPVESLALTEAASTATDGNFLRTATQDAIRGDGGDEMIVARLLAKRRRVSGWQDQQIETLGGTNLAGSLGPRDSNTGHQETSHNKSLGRTGNLNRNVPEVLDGEVVLPHASARLLDAWKKQPTRQKSTVDGRTGSPLAIGKSDEKQQEAQEIAASTVPASRTDFDDDRKPIQTAGDESANDGRPPSAIPSSALDNSSTGDRAALNRSAGDPILGDDARTRTSELTSLRQINNTSGLLSSSGGGPVASSAANTRMPGLSSALGVLATSAQPSFAARQSHSLFPSSSNALPQEPQDFGRLTSPLLLNPAAQLDGLQLLARLQSQSSMQRGMWDVGSVYRNISNLPLNPFLVSGMAWPTRGVADSFSASESDLVRRAGIRLALGANSSLPQSNELVNRGASAASGNFVAARDLPALSPAARGMGPVAPPSLPIILALPEDETKLSAYQLLLRNQIEAFAASADDVTTHARGRNRPITLRQVGIRCRHCKHLPPSKRKKGSVYFPFALVGLYQAAQNMGTSHFHGDSCDQMPADIKQKFVDILACKSTVGAGKQYWARAAQRIGLVDTNNGIRVAQDLEFVWR